MRFRLRSLLVAVTGAAVIAAASSIATRDLHKRNAAERDLKSIGAYYVGFDEKSRPTWVGFVEPIRSGRISDYRSLRQLDLAGATIDDSTAEHIAGFHQLEAIHLSGARLSDRQLQLIAQIGSLKILRLGGTSITDSSIDAIASINGLLLVDLSNTSVTDDGVARLRNILPDVTIRR